MDRNEIARRAFQQGVKRSGDQVNATVPLIGEGSRPPRLGIVIPSGDQVNANFAMMLAAMTYAMGIPIGLFNPKGSNIANNRNNGVRKCFEEGYDYCLMIDSDVAFPTNAALRLLAQAKRHDLDIIGATYVGRSQPHQNHAKPLKAEGIGAKTFVSGLAEVSGLPAGFLMFNMRVLDKISRPWFRFATVEEGQPLPAIYADMVPADYWGPIGEDYDFCARARAGGCRVWLDTELSFELIHYGEVGYRIRAEENEHGRLYDSVELSA